MNYPPMHPNDRCTTVVHFGVEALDNLKRRAKDPKTGKSYFVEPGTSFEEWKEKVLKRDSKSGKINIEIDKFVPCLEDAKTGEILPTQVKTLDRSKLKQFTQKDGWGVDWGKRPKDEKVLGVFLKGDDNPQGLISLRRDNGAVYIGFVSTAPQNNKELNGGNQKYLGVGGHLFAAAVEESIINKNPDGCIYGYAANEKLLNHYIKKFSAKRIPVIHEYQFEVSGVAAKELIEKYNYERKYSDE